MSGAPSAADPHQLADLSIAVTATEDEEQAAH